MLNILLTTDRGQTPLTDAVEVIARYDDEYSMHYVDRDDYVEMTECAQKLERALAERDKKLAEANSKCKQITNLLREALEILPGRGDLRRRIIQTLSSE